MHNGRVEQLVRAPSYTTHHFTPLTHGDPVTTPEQERKEGRKEEKREKQSEKGEKRRIN